MASILYRPCYATRRQVKTALDIKLTADYDAHVDTAIMKASDDIDGLCHRRFYNLFTTNYVNWPNFQRAYPWRVWLGEHEIADITGTVPIVKSGGNVIPANQIKWGPWETGDPPPYTFLELDRSTSASFGQGNTPQQDISIQAVFGYWNKTRAAGSLAAAITDTTSTTITISDSSLADVGDVLTVDSESLLVTDTAMVSTGLTQSGAGCSTASEADNLLSTTGSGALHVGETVQLDGERMFIESLAGVATVERPFDGTVLATHTNATVYALRSLTVVRGWAGTTAATHSNAAPLTAAVVPAQVNTLAIAEALNTVLQQVTGYARTVGENLRTMPGGSLPNLRDQVFTRYARKHRSAVI